MDCLRIYMFILALYAGFGGGRSEYVIYTNNQNIISSNFNISSDRVFINSVYGIPLMTEDILGSSIPNVTVYTSVDVPSEIGLLNRDITYELNVTFIPCDEYHTKTYATVLSTRNSSSINFTAEFSDLLFNIQPRQNQTTACKDTVTWKINLDLQLSCNGCTFKEDDSQFSWKKNSLRINRLRLELLDPVCDFDQHCSWTYNPTVIEIRSPNDKCTQKAMCPSLPRRDASGLASSGNYGLSKKSIGIPRLQSPIIYGSGPNCQLHVSHWMYSPTTINVSLLISSIPLFITSIHSPYMKRKWRNTVVDIGRISQPFQIQISFTFNRIPYIALDNLILVNCDQLTNSSNTCAKDEFACSTGTCIKSDRTCDLVQDCFFGEDETVDVCGDLPSRSQCKFENDTCGWKNVEQKDSVCGMTRSNISGMKLREIGTPLEIDTPQEDFAMLLDGDNCERAVMRSDVHEPFSDDLENKCKIKFSYYLEARGYIDFGICNENASDCQLLWHNDLQISGPIWSREVVAIPYVDNRYTMVFDITEYMHGDIIIDDISLTKGCFTKLDKSQEVMYTNATVEAVQSSRKRNSDLLLTILGAVIGGIIGISTACIIFSAYKRQRKKTVNDPYKKVSAQSSVSSSMIDEKSAFQLFSPDTSMDSECERLVSPPESLAVSSISPYYEWIEQSDALIRNIPRRKIRLMRLIGKGAFGEVYYGLLADVAHLQRELPVAVKTLPSLCSEQTKSEFFFEALTLSKFKHPNIVRFLGISIDDRSMYLIIELMDGGDLRSFVRDSRPRQPYQPSYLTVQDLLKLAIDVAKGCKYLEENRFIHRDIAARNCLLTEKGPKRVAKIGDFGMARDIFRTNYYRKNGVAMVPVKWMPPEGFLDGVFTSKTDVWAFGVVLWEIFTMGYVPYPGKSNADVMKFVSDGGRLEVPCLCPTKLNALMQHCWSTEPEDRPGFIEVVRSLEKCYKEDDLGSLITFEDISTKSDTYNQGQNTSKSVPSTSSVSTSEEKVEYATGLQTCYTANIKLEDVTT